MTDYSRPTPIGEAFAAALRGTVARRRSPQPPFPDPSISSAPSPRLVDITEACELLHCSRSLLYRLIVTRQIIPIKLGRLTRIPLASIDAFIALQINATLAGR